MARFANTFQAQTPIGAALQNIATAFFSGPTPMEREQTALEADYLRARSEDARSSAALNTQKLGAPGQFAGALQRGLGPLREAAPPSPSFVGPMPAMTRDEQVRQEMAPLAQAAASGGAYSEIGNLLLALTANAPGTSTDAVTRSFVGSGGKLGENDAVSLDRQDQIRSENAARQKDLEISKLFAAPAEVSAGGTLQFGVGDPRGAGGPLQGRDTESTATGTLINRVAAGDELSPAAAAITGAMEKENNPANPAESTRFVVTPTAGGKFEYQPVSPGLAAPSPGSAGARFIPANINAAMLDNMAAIQKVDQAVEALKAYPDAVGVKGYMPDDVLKRTDPKGVQARAIIADIGSLKIHDRSGAAVTASEFPRLRPFIPSPTDDDKVAMQKLANFRNEYMNMLQAQHETYSEAGGYQPNAVVGQFLQGGGTPQTSGATSLDTDQISIDSAVQQAREAIEQGADPTAVAERFRITFGQDLPE